MSIDPTAYKNKIDSKNFKKNPEFFEGTCSLWRTFLVYIVNDRNIFDSLVGDGWFQIVENRGKLVQVLLWRYCILDAGDGLFITKLILDGKLQNVFYTSRKDEVHYEHGPAYTLYNGFVVEEYYLNGQKLPKEKWEEQVATKLYW